MNKIISPKFEAKLLALVYRYKFIILYTLIGFTSIVLELVIRSQFMRLGISDLPSSFVSIAIGIAFAFYANIKINFRVPKQKIKISLIYFFSISLFSISIQYFLKQIIFESSISYESGRLLISSIVFLIAYYFHRKYSFKDFKKVGVAVYANGIENLERIHHQIGQLPDFIHVDIVDTSMNPESEEIKTYRMETIRAYWPDSQIQTHIMSRTPSKWLDQVIEYSDVVYVHAECDEDISEIFRILKNNNKLTGLALTMQSDIQDYIRLLDSTDFVLLLTIDNPGYSGQNFSIDGLSKIQELSRLPHRNDFHLCVDGGVDTKNINKINAEYIVSGSSVLKSENPKRVIMNLQTIGRYEIS